MFVGKILGLLTRSSHTLRIAFKELNPSASAFQLWHFCLKMDYPAQG